MKKEKLVCKNLENILLKKKNKELSENYDRIYNENCKLREEHNITNISLLDENYKLKINWNELKKYIRKTKLKQFEGSYCKRYGKIFTQAEIITCDMILDKMRELERGNKYDL